MVQISLDNIAFCAFYTFLMKVHLSEAKNQVSAKIYNCCACICNSDNEIRVAGDPEEPAINYFKLQDKNKIK